MAHRANSWSWARRFCHYIFSQFLLCNSLSDDILLASHLLIAHTDTCFQFRLATQNPEISVEDGVLLWGLWLWWEGGGSAG